MFVITVRSFGIIGAGAVLFGAGAIVGQQILTVAGEVQHIISLILDDFETFQELDRQWHWELVQAARLPSALRGQANAAFLVLDGGEGSSAQDRVDCTEKSFCVAHTGEQCCLLNPSPRVQFCRARTGRQDNAASYLQDLVIIALDFKNKKKKKNGLLEKK